MTYGFLLVHEKYEFFFINDNIFMELIQPDKRILSNRKATQSTGIMAVISTFSVDIKIAVIIGDFMLYLIPLWKRIEVVITSRTRNAVVLTGTWVRIPPLPPRKEELFALCYWCSSSFTTLFTTNITADAATERWLRRHGREDTDSAAVTI